MKDRLAQIRLRLAILNPTLLEISDESHKHAGHAGARSGGGHFMLRMVSPQFTGKSTMNRHRMIYSALGDMMRAEIHALTIQAHAPEDPL
jgi:BolA protein